jgi:hypothetical protein
VPPVDFIKLTWI